MKLNDFFFFFSLFSLFYWEKKVDKCKNSPSDSFQFLDVVSDFDPTFMIFYYFYKANILNCSKFINYKILEKVWCIVFKK